MILDVAKPIFTDNVPTPPRPCCGNCAKQRRGPSGKECRALPPGPDGRYPWANDISWCALYERKVGE